MVTPSTQRATSGAELLAHLLDSYAGILHHVVQQPRFHGHHIHPHVGENMRHHHRMSHVGLTRIASLALVAPAGKIECLAQRAQIFLGAILADLGFQLGVQLLDRVL